jgi:hypothetical protein
MFINLHFESLTVEKDLEYFLNNNVINNNIKENKLIADKDEQIETLKKLLEKQ